MEEQKPCANSFLKGKQQNENSHKHQNCEHQYLNRKFTDLFVEVQFDEQLPIKLKGCVIEVDLLEHQKQLLIQHGKCLQQKQKSHFDHNHSKITQPFIIISYKSTLNNKELSLLIPLDHIMCVAKKSMKTTLLMIKDKQKTIEFDQNGYELVSDQQQDEVQQYAEKTNKLYQKIKKAVNQINTCSFQQSLQQQQEMQQIQNHEKSQHFNEHYHRSVIKIDQKCNIMFSPMVEKQSSQKPQQHNSSQALELYNFFSHKLEQHEKMISQNQQQNNGLQWRGQVQQMNLLKQVYENMNGINGQQMMQMQHQYLGQQEEMDDEDNEDDIDLDQQDDDEEDANNEQ